MASSDAPRISFPDGPVPPVRSLDDHAGRMRLREQNVREHAVAIEEIKLLREAVAECYRREGVNHLENCKEEVAAFRARTKGKFPEYGALIKKVGDE